MPIELIHSYETDNADSSINSQTETSAERDDSLETPIESPGENTTEDENGDVGQTEIDFYDLFEDEKVINSKEDIKYLIDKSKNSQELYKNAIKILTNMEQNFKDTMVNIYIEEGWNEKELTQIWYSSFNHILNTDNPKTIFEKKGKELLERANAIQEELNVQNSASQTIGSEGLNLSGISENEKNQLIEELFQTREDAIQGFKEDISDGLLSNENNVSKNELLSRGLGTGMDLFELKEEDVKKFEEKVKNMNLSQLILSTFNMNKGSGAFTYCYGNLKEKLGDKNLFDYIDEQNKKSGDIIQEALKYSVFKMLFKRRMTSDLVKTMDRYNGNKEELLKYVEKNIEDDEDFKVSFLTSIKDLEKSKYFGKIAQNLKENNLDVKKAYEAASNIDNIDIFRDKKVNGLVLYDDEGHGGGSAYFDADFKGYQKKGFSVISREDNGDYTKYTLKKGGDSIFLVKLKCHDGRYVNLDNTLKLITNGQNCNLFALRGHCYNTEVFADTLGRIGVAGEGSLLIDGGCFNAGNTRDYYESGVKGEICAYTGMGKGVSTQAFIDRIIIAKNRGQKFSDVLLYYDGLATDSGKDGYFANNTKRPDNVGFQYEKFSRKYTPVENTDEGEDTVFRGGFGVDIETSVEEMPTEPLRAEIPVEAASVGAGETEVSI